VALVEFNVPLDTGYFGHFSCFSSSQSTDWCRTHNTHN